MALDVLFIGGTGQISLPCVELAVKAGHKVSVFNRGIRDEKLPRKVKVIAGDMKDEKAYRRTRQDKVGRRLPVHGVQARADAARHRNLHRQRRSVRLHLVGLGLREAGSPLCHHREDASGEPILALQPRQDPCEELLRKQKKFPWTSCARATPCARGFRR